MLFCRVLITGANGLLGQALVSCLSRFPEYDILATGRDSAPRFLGGSCGYAQLDITNPTDVKYIFQDFTPDVVINCAAMTQVDVCEVERGACWRVNVEAVSLLAKWCLMFGSRLVQISSDFIFDGSAGMYHEADKPNPISFYGKSKQAAENAARGAGLDNWAIVRTVLLYGTGEKLSRSNFVLWIVETLSRKEPIHVVTDQWRTPTFVQDLASGIERIVRYEKCGIYHLSGKDFVSIYDFACLVAEIYGLDHSLILPTDASQFDQPASRPPRTGFIILKAETELGFAPHSIRDALLVLEKSLDRLATPT